MEKWKNWELWPFWLCYLLITPVWFWYCLRARSFWFFTPSNPTLSFGGFEGESKREMYEQLPPGSYPKTIYIKPGIPFKELTKTIEEAGFSHPFIVKPDVGMAGILFRKIDNWVQLERYHERMPVQYLVQDLVKYPVEFSVFYYRFPNASRGVITGFLQKEPLHVIGDGASTLLVLINGHPKAKHRLEELLAWHKDRLGSVPPVGEKFYLTHAANLNRGAHFINLHSEIDEDLHRVFDKLNAESGSFFYGRYDLKATDLASLKKGEHFQVLEYNGSGAEPNHIYNSGYSLRAAHKEILKHWKVLFEISTYNRARGIRYDSTLSGWRSIRSAKKHFALLNKIDGLL
jgi:hypothetical protein